MLQLYTFSEENTKRKEFFPAKIKSNANLMHMKQALPKIYLQQLIVITEDHSSHTPLSGRGKKKQN